MLGWEAVNIVCNVMYVIEIVYEFLCNKILPIKKYACCCLYNLSDYCNNIMVYYRTKLCTPNVN